MDAGPVPRWPRGAPPESRHLTNRSPVPWPAGAAGRSGRRRLRARPADASGRSGARLFRLERALNWEAGRDQRAPLRFRLTTHRWSISAVGAASGDGVVDGDDAAMASLRPVAEAVITGADCSAGS